MGESINSTIYYCHLCAQRVSPISEPDLKCPNCDTGFIEEIHQDFSDDEEENYDSVPINSRPEQRPLSSWAPVLLGMMSHHHSSDPDSDPARILRRPIRREREFEGESEGEEGENEDSDFDNEDEIDREIDDIFRRSRRRSAILQLLESLRDDVRTESERGERERESEREEIESLILINQSNHQAIILPAFLDSEETGTEFGTGTGSIGDYFLGPGLDLLLQHLAETDPSRYGSPPAKREAVEALPSVKIVEELSCSVCLEDFEIGGEGKEMPCKHKFHEGCILPWLELHSSCPVCRFEMESEERKEGEMNGNGNGNGSVSEATPSTSTDPS